MSVECGDGEPIDVDTQRTARARKEHRCDACKETIERGHLYVRHTLIYAGEVDETIRCLRCDAIYQQLVAIHREVNDRAREVQHKLHWELRGDQRRLTEEERRYVYHEPEWPDLALNCGHEFTKRWGREPPPEPELARLAFITPAELQAEALAKLGQKP